MNILFYGNCQLFAVLKTLNMSKDYNIFHVECWKNEINEKYFKDIIIKSDIIITQPINDNYRDVNYLSTTYITQHKKPDCKLIIELFFHDILVCMFWFYYSIIV